MENLHSQNITSGGPGVSTQKYLDVAEIKDDIIILKNGSLRKVLGVSAINFDLKSTDEQIAIIEQYQNFLNSLDFPVQILVSSRKLNIDDYLEFIEEKEKQQPNELLKLQISEYRIFVKELISIANIMDKFFYIIIPFAPIENQEKGFVSNMLSRLNPQKNILEKRTNFETYKSQLLQRVDHVISALSGIGLRMIPLHTQELIELLFNSYNPSLFNNSGIADVNKLELK